jgi:hypothetical protein
VVLNPSRPAAVVNGRTVFVGSRIQDFHVTAITPDSVILVGAGQTNILMLER